MEATHNLITLNWLQQKSLSQQVITLALLSILAWALIYTLILFLDPVTITEFSIREERPELIALLAAIIVGPLLETLIFQTALLLILKKATELAGSKDNWLPAFIGTVILFSASHGNPGDTPYLFFISTLVTIPPSISLACLAIAERTRERGRPFLAVAMLHGVYNILVLTIQLLVNLLLV